MEEDHYRKTQQSLDPHACVFKKALLARKASCSLAESMLLAERETFTCGNKAAQQHCLAFLQITKLQSRFVIKEADMLQALPHAKEMKLQVGSLNGVAIELLQLKDAMEMDIAATMQNLERDYSSFEQLPFNKIIPYVQNYKVRGK
ncbi:MAG: hypothetical protein OEZ58_06095 [Gammaproteobacteria bacterium]|nr:hypothetical protein [Gammaproteobacteria bacterium]MDH5728540.1 hypothetical protein [Gammaproteobacteria bacterium]